MALFSNLAKGAGTWSGHIVPVQEWDRIKSHEDTSNVLPLLRDDEADQRQHRHGVTIRPTSRCTNISRAKSAASTYTSYSGQKVDGELKLPKTFLTRKGALLLFSSPDPDQELSEKEKDYLQHARKLLKHRYKDYCSKLGGSVDRLVQSILMFGDQETEKDGRSISDEENKAFLGFLHHLDDRSGDLHTQPGGDCDFYLKDLCDISRSGSALSRPPSVRFAFDNQALYSGHDRNDLLTPDPDMLLGHPGMHSRRSSHNSIRRYPSPSLSPHHGKRVLSASKLQASIKSNSYLGQPLTTPGSLDGLSRPNTPMRHQSPLERESPQHLNAAINRGRSPSQSSYGNGRVYKPHITSTSLPQLTPHSHTPIQTVHENDTESHMSNACTEHADDNAHLSHTLNTPVFPDGERIDSDTEITVSDIFEHGDKVGEERTDGEAARGNSALNMEDEERERMTAHVEGYLHQQNKQRKQPWTSYHSVDEESQDTYDTVDDQDEKRFRVSIHDEDGEEQSNGEQYEEGLVQNDSFINPLQPGYEDDALFTSHSTYTSQTGQSGHLEDDQYSADQDNLEETFLREEDIMMMNAEEKDKEGDNVSAVMSVEIRSRRSSCASSHSGMPSQRSLSPREQALDNEEIERRLSTVSVSRCESNQYDSPAASRRTSRGQSRQSVAYSDDNRPVGYIRSPVSSGKSSHSSSRADTPQLAGEQEQPVASQMSRLGADSPGTETGTMGGEGGGGVTDNGPDKQRDDTDSLIKISQIHVDGKDTGNNSSVIINDSATVTLLKLSDASYDQHAKVDTKSKDKSSKNTKTKAVTKPSEENTKPKKDTQQTKKVDKIKQENAIAKTTDKVDDQKNKPLDSESKDGKRVLKTSNQDRKKGEKEKNITPTDTITNDKSVRQNDLSGSLDQNAATDDTENVRNAGKPAENTSNVKHKESKKVKWSTGENEKNNDKKAGPASEKKEYVQAMDISSVNKDKKDSEDKDKYAGKKQSIMKPQKKPQTSEAEHKTKGDTSTKPEQSAPTVKPDVDNKKAEPDYQKELLAWLDKPAFKPEKTLSDEEVAKIKKRAKKPTTPPLIRQKTKEELKLAQLERDMNEILPGQAKVDGEGEELTVEELELEQQILKEKMAAVENKMNNDGDKTKRRGTRAPAKKQQKKKKEVDKSPKRDLAQEREALREAKKEEKRRRLEEAKALEGKIAAMEEEKKKESLNANKKKQLLQEDIDAIRWEEDQARIAEEEAREMLAETRKAARAAREKNRKAEIERKKQEIQRQRQEQKEMMEAARQKEKDMLSQIQNAGRRRRNSNDSDPWEREEEERRKREEEEEQDRLARQAVEDEEERYRELERQAEEEAVSRLVAEREKAESQRWALLDEARKIEEEENKRKEMIEIEKQKLEDERLKQQEEEERQREDARFRMAQLKQAEEDARNRMLQEVDKRRELALMRREQNLERRGHLHSMRQGQGITKPWIFSYYINWPRETYERKMGEDTKKKKGFRPPPKPKPKPKPAE